MKQLRILLLLAITGIASASAASVPLATALKQHLVSVTISERVFTDDSLYHSSFTGDCIMLTIKNLQATAIDITEEPGRFLMPDDSSEQRMMITAPMFVHLAPNQQKDQPVFAMCTEAHDGAPADDMHFRYGNVAPESLVSVAQFIAQHRYQNESGQQAVWCISNDYSPYDIYSSDTVVQEQLRRCVCKLKSVPYQKNFAGTRAEMPHLIHVKGMFGYEIPKPMTVDLKVFDSENKLVKVLADHELQPKGDHEYNYELYVPVNEGAPPTFWVRFYLDGEMFDEKKYELTK